jgi:hypothetical protein
MVPSNEKLRRSASHFSGKSLTDDKRRQIPSMSLSSFKNGSNSSKIRLLQAFDSHNELESLLVSVLRNFKGFGMDGFSDSPPHAATSGFALESVQNKSIEMIHEFTFFTFEVTL